MRAQGARPAEPSAPARWAAGESPAVGAAQATRAGPAKARLGMAAAGSDRVAAGAGAEPPGVGSAAAGPGVGAGRAAAVPGAAGAGADAPGGGAAWAAAAEPGADGAAVPGRLPPAEPDPWPGAAGPGGSGRSPWPARGAWAALVLAAALVLVALRGILLPFVLAAALAYLIAPAVTRLHRLGLPRAWAILVTYALIAAAAAAFVAFVLPDLVTELQNLARAIPPLVARLQAVVAGLRAGYHRLPLPAGLRRAVDAALGRAEAAGERTLRQATADLLGGFHVLFALVLAPVLTYYVLADLPRLRERFAGLLPPPARQPVLSCLADLDAVLAGFLRGELLISAVVGVLATVAALLLHLRYAFTLGLVEALGELIPYFGPVLGALPALGVAAVQGGLGLTVETGLAYLIIQQLESALLAPRIVGASVGLHPVVAIAALLAGERAGGLAGLFVAVPAVACLRVLGTHVVRALTAHRAPRRLT